MGYPLSLEGGNSSRKYLWMIKWWRRGRISIRYEQRPKKKMSVVVWVQSMRLFLTVSVTSKYTRSVNAIVAMTRARPRALEWFGKISASITRPALSNEKVWKRMNMYVAATPILRPALFVPSLAYAATIAASIMRHAQQPAIPRTTRGFRPNLSIVNAAMMVPRSPTVFQPHWNINCFTVSYPSSEYIFGPAHTLGRYQTYHNGSPYRY